MSELISQKPADDADFILGQILGSRRAFSSVAGRCSAVAVDCMRRVRDEKLFTNRAETWDEFCPKFLGMSRAKANRVIGYLEEFGPAYFELAEFTRISPSEFRAIASSVKDNAVHWQGEAIALIPENSAKITEAVGALRKAAEPVPKKSSRAQKIASLRRACTQVVVEFGDLWYDPSSPRDSKLWAIVVDMFDRLWGHSLEA